MAFEWEKIDPIVNPWELDDPVTSWGQNDPIDKPIGLGEAILQDPLEKIPFSPVGPAKLGALVLASKRLQRDDYSTFVSDVNKFAGSMEGIGGYTPTFGPVTPRVLPDIKAEAARAKQEDVEFLTAYFEEQTERSQRGYTLFGKVGQITSAMPSFMIEFLATGGLKKLGSEAAKQGATKLLRGYAATTVGKAVIGTSGFATGVALRAAGMPHRAASAILKRQIPQDMQISDSGEVKITGPIEKPFTSLWKGLADHYIEIASEQAGEFIAPFASRVFRKLPLMGKLTGALQKKWINLKPGRTISSFRKAIGTKTGFHGVVGEVGEEYLGDVTRAITDVEHFGSGENAGMLERIGAAVRADTENLPAMLIAFSVPGAATGVANIAVQRQRIQNEKRQAELNLITGLEINAPTQIETAEGTVGYEDDFFMEKWYQSQPKYKFDTPGIGKFFTPKWALNRLLGTEILLEDVVKAEEAHQIEKLHLNGWIGKLIPKLKKEKNLTRLPEILPVESEKEATVVKTAPETIETAEGILGANEDFEIEITDTTKTKAHILQKKIGSDSNPTHIMRDLLDTYENAPSFLNESETKIFNQIRELTRYLRQRANLVRERMGLEPIAKVEGYITHWMDRVANRVVAKDLPIHSGYLYTLMKGLPKKIKNPTAMKRKVKGQMEKYFSKDLGKLLRIMTAYDLKDIYLMEPYQAAWDELQTLRESKLIPDSTYKEVEDFLLYDVRKHQAPMDKAFNRVIKVPIDLLNKLLPVKKVIDDPARSVFSSLRRLGHISGLGLRLRPANRNLGQRLLLTDLYRTVDYAKAQAVAFRLSKMPIVEHPQSEENTPLIELVREQDWYKLALRKFEDTVTAVTGVERGALYLYSKTHIGNLFLSNVEVAAITGYFDWENMYNQSKDVKSRHFKNVLKQSKRLGIPPVELLTRKNDMMWHIREAVRRTQWEYFSISMPAFYRSQFNRAMGMFQSWWMNYFFNHSREMINQSITGRNSLGRLLTPGGRLRAAKGLGTIQAISRVAETLFGVQMLKYLFLPLPGYMPPIPSLIVGLIQFFGADDEKERKTAWRKVKRGLKFWIPFSAFGRDLNKLLSGEYSISDFLLYKTEKKK